MAKKLILGQIWSLNFFLWVLPIVDVIHCCKLSLYPISREINEPNLKKKEKPSLGKNFGPFGQNCPPPPPTKKKFLLTLPPLDIRRKCKLSLYAI